MDLMGKDSPSDAPHTTLPARRKTRNINEIRPLAGVFGGHAVLQCESKRAISTLDSMKGWDQ
jgi:hypothetical protein